MLFLIFFANISLDGGEFQIKLDYTITSIEERKKIVSDIVATNENLTNYELEALANYLVTCMEKAERAEKRILTDNRLVTINKRETHYDSDELIQSLSVEPTKNARFCPKISITDTDAELPFMAQLRDTIRAFEQSDAEPARIRKKAIIEMRKDQYIIKEAYRKPIIFNKITRGIPSSITFEDTSYINERGNLVIGGVSLMDPKVIAGILRNYSLLKEGSWDKLNADTRYLLDDFDRISSSAIMEKPIYYTIMVKKIDNCSNAEISSILTEKFGVNYTLEYISLIWCKKIPNLIADYATKEFYTLNYKKTKKCGRCGQVKPATLLFFSKNNKSKDNLYSICKECRKKARQQIKQQKEMVENGK